MPNSNDTMETQRRAPTGLDPATQALLASVELQLIELQVAFARALVGAPEPAAFAGRDLSPLGTSARS